MRVFLADPMPEACAATLRASGATVVTRLADADAAIVRTATRVDPAWLARAPRLTVLGRAGIGCDTIDLQACSACGVAVFTTPDAPVASVAELTLGLLLAVARKIPRAHAELRQGAWSRAAFIHGADAGTELFGKTLGLFGCGRIGRAVAERAHAFGMRVIATDPALSDPPPPPVAALLDFDALLAECDVLSLHAPLTKTTRRVLGARAFQALRPGALLINTARGALIEPEALAEALRSGRLAGVGLDVFDPEPPETPPWPAILNDPRVVATCHLGSATREARLRVATEIARSVCEALRTGVVAAAVNARELAAREDDAPP